MTDYDIQPIRVDEAQLASYAALFSQCFPGGDAFSPAYLKWLYRDNPEGAAVGFDAWKNGALAAHYVTIPVAIALAGKQCRALLSLNTATHPDHRGQGLFTLLAQKTYDEAAAQGYAAVIGVANQNSTHGFTKKLGFQLVKPLDAFIGLGLPRLDSAAQTAPSLSRIWNAKSYAWRAGNPRNPLRCFSQNGSAISIARSTLPFLPVISRRNDVDAGITSAMPVLSSMRPYICLGAWPQGVKPGMNYFKIPDRLKPSPLHFIYLPLGADKTALAPEGIFFDFIDFDAF